ncbi:MAG: MerR family transcriptional regulator [Hyphomicrobiaceae bacterium]
MTKSADAFRTISEVAEELDLHKHVLRFWEVKFPQIKPMKRGGGRRYYRPADLELLRGIRHLLHSEGYTIKGVQRIIREKGIDAVKRGSSDAPATDTDAGAVVAEAVPQPHARGAPAAAKARRGRQSAHVIHKTPLVGTGPSPSVARSSKSTLVDKPAAIPAGRLKPEGREILLAALTELKALRAMLAGTARSSTGNVEAGSAARRSAG